MMKFPLPFIRQALALLVVVSCLCGSVAQIGVGCHVVVHGEDDGESEASFVSCGGDGGHSCHEQTASCGDHAGDDCPDYPHHHHDGVCCYFMGQPAARVAPVIALNPPAHNRAELEWLDMHCDLDAVRELNDPPII